MPTFYKLPSIIGLPPWNLESRTNEMILNSMPIAEITPSWPSFEGGIDLFNITPDIDRYRGFLNSYGYEIDGGAGAQSIKLAFIADSFPTDTFQNEYGENFLQKFTNVASEGAASINQFFGTTRATEAGQMLINRLSGAGGVAGAVGKGLGAGADVAKNILGVLAPEGSGRSRALDLTNRLMAGARIDFPQVWKSSSFTPSYTMTVRLYNPYPRSDEATKRFIIGPIAAIMLLGTPISEDGGTYNWPFLHEIKATGIYTLSPAFIQSITIVKGGDQQQISQNQRLSMADVRIDFGSLYNSMITGKNINPSRPTLKKYLKALEGKRSISDRLGEETLDGTEPALTPRLAPTYGEEITSVVSPRTSITTKNIQTSLDVRNTILS